MIFNDAVIQSTVCSVYILCTQSLKMVLRQRLEAGDIFYILFLTDSVID